MSKTLLRGYKEMMQALKIESTKTFYKQRKRLPIRKVDGALVADRDELIEAYLNLDQSTPESE
jgi:hypothetical protein